MKYPEYVDSCGKKAIHCESELYGKIVNGRHFKQVQKEAEDLGMPVMSAAAATDEVLVYFIYKNRAAKMNWKYYLFLTVFFAAALLFMAAGCTHLY